MMDPPRSIRNSVRFDSPRRQKRSYSDTPISQPSHARRESLFRKSIVLHHRLQELLVLEIDSDGNRKYKHMNLRALYNYVLSIISSRPTGPEISNDTTRRLASPAGTRKYFESVKIVNPEPFTAEGLCDTKMSFEKNQIGNDSPALEVNPTARKKALSHITYRERLGGYLHPRDMRRLVTPFSASNEPQLIVRRHVMLLNVDPLRTIVLRDRILVLVPDGADSILETLEKRIKNGLNLLEDPVFDDECDSSTSTQSGLRNRKTSYQEQAEALKEKSWMPNPDLGGREVAENIESTKSRSERFYESGDDNAFGVFDSFGDGEWDELRGKAWINLPFELQSLDAVLYTVSAILTDEAKDLEEYSRETINHLLISNDYVGGEHGQDLLRSLKGDISEMGKRVQGFIRAINLVLDEDEDLALMNLSRLITHPERFIQPVSEQILQEESDEPELILESYLQESLTNTNTLDLLKGEIGTVEELMNMKLDAIRNRLLYVNTVVSLFTLAIGIGSFVGSLFGMNLENGLEKDPNAWGIVVCATCICSFGVLVLLCLVLYRVGVLPKIGLKAYNM